jgi:hypothetical protein
MPWYLLGSYERDYLMRDAFSNNQIHERGPMIAKYILLTFAACLPVLAQ